MENRHKTNHAITRIDTDRRGFSSWLNLAMFYNNNNNNNNDSVNDNDNNNDNDNDTDNDNDNDNDIKK